jgi:hypothetical protein
MSTTYMAGTLTGMLTALVTRNRRAGLWRDVTALAALAAGGCTGAVLIRFAQAWLPALIVLPLGTVIAAAGRLHLGVTAAGG